MNDNVEIDLTYAIGEIQDIQAELETYKLSDLASRLEGVEVRIKELTDTLLTYFVSAITTGPYFAANQAYQTLAPPLEQE